MTVRLDNSSTSLPRSAMLHSWDPQGFQSGKSSGGFVLGRIGIEHAGELSSRRLQDTGDLGRRCLDEAENLAAQRVERGHGREIFDALHVQPKRVEATPDDFQLFVLSGELDGHL